MREHMGLYRGKRIDNGEWLEGNLLMPENYPPEIMWYTAERGFSSVPIHPDTVGECTGLRDKNGKLIFEGDVVRVYGDDLPHWMGAGEIRVVKYDHDGYTPFSEYDSDCGEYVRAKDCEIIGNVADNSELLKGGEGE